jgi:excisionase family DNA binding protein
VDDYLTVNGVAELLKLSVQTIRRYTMNKEIPFRKINRAVRYRKTDIDLWLIYKRTYPVKELCQMIMDDTFQPPFENVKVGELV